MRRGWVGRVATTLVVAVVAVGCTSDEGWKRAHDAPLPDDVAGMDVTVTGSIEQVHVSGAAPEQPLALHERGGRVVATADTDDQGSLVFRDVAPGDGYRVATVTAPIRATEPIEVVSVESSLPPQSFYDEQVLEPGFGYITTRDGTTLSTSVYLPGPIEDGPYPTVVEYSGYDPSRPGTNLLAEHAAELGPVAGEDPSTLCGIVSFACNAPAQPSSLLALSMGYAVVAVNVRGTGCSGGSYSFFETLQVTDGYDVVETTAAQPWVKDHRVGMVGLSYPGISQLFVAAGRPPSLAAITPLSVFDDPVRGTLAPGGIFNSGFALSWAEEVGRKAQAYGQGWEQARVDGGDTTCAANQRFRGQNVDLSELAQSYSHYEPEIADRLNPSLFVDRIDVPVYMTGSFQDEQTGGRSPLLFEHFSAAPVARLTVQNGAHADGYAPVNLTEWKTFLDLYVADRITQIPGVVKVFAPLIMKEIFDAELELGDPRFLDAPSAAAARASYEQELPVRVLLESGAGDPDQPGAPVPTVEVRTTQWPPPGTRPTVFELGAHGSMTTDATRTDPSGPDTGAAASTFVVDPDLATRTTYDETRGSIFHALPDYDWQQEPAGSASVFVSEPLEEDHVFAGSASADLWLRTDADDADVGVTLSEVRPDGKETFIQAGVLRASNRKVAAGSTALLPLHSLLKSDSEPLEPGRWAKARIEIFPFAHIARAGSRIRLSVHTPGGDRPRWTYLVAPQPSGTSIDVGHSAAHPSRLVLPESPALLSGTSYPSALPPCPGLRGQPCRTFVPYENHEIGS